MAAIEKGHFINRELSWLEFNQRVLDEARDPLNPLLERLKFLGIANSNLDEFFEVRVAGLKQQIESEVLDRSADGRTPSGTFRAVTKRVRQMVEEMYDCWGKELEPMLAKRGIRLLSMKDLGPRDAKWVEHYYRTEIHPVLTPVAIDPAHPFPQVANKSTNMIVRLEASFSGERLRHQVVIQLPRILPRLVKLPRATEAQDYVFLGAIIRHFLAELMPGTKILGSWHFRVTRNSELYIDEEETANLLKAVENELHNRRKGAAVRLEIEKGCPHSIVTALLATLSLGEEDLYRVDGPLNLQRLLALSSGDHSPELRDPPFVVPAMDLMSLGTADLFQAVRERDLLLHHPYDTFETVVDFLEQAAKDPQVIAIKQTLYRTGGDERVVGALMTAARQGKHVTAVVELRARFDEANNIQWARRLEEEGVQVVYGLVGFKIHCKMALVVRREEGGIRRYVHLGTGNYNPTTARLYTDLSLLTAQPDFGEDATNLFNLLTGICQFQGMRKFLVAPFQLHTKFLDLIRQETENARQGLPARIIAKMNSLVDEQIIDALYQASQAGVQIDLLVRGVCCLRPGRPRLSENIRVRSIVDRFLEHSRIFYFENACRPVVYVASADWMPRNFFRRVELAFPVEDGLIRDRIIQEVLATHLADNTKARLLQPDGSYRMSSPGPGEKPLRSQGVFLDRAVRRQGRMNQAVEAGLVVPEMRLAPSPFDNSPERLAAS